MLYVLNDTLKKKNGPEQRQHVCISLARQPTNNISIKQLGTTSNMQNKSHTFISKIIDASQ
jgi:hypothetical protein